ncbi:hypothetical protein [Nocardiopsis synnemataformans]|uniref:hypothetical protein n=1 Tax=Nocardiopsis synnemataformans TaxID=61305 RepID=UPI003EBFB28A
MPDPATALTRHDEDHGRYTDRPSLTDQLAAAFTGALTELFDVHPGHSCTGDIRHLEDDAKVLAKIAEGIVGQRVRHLEAEIDRLRAYLAYATHWDVCGTEVYPQGDAWMCKGTELEEFDDPGTALARARQLAGL